jgi:hypothetical protein
MGFWNRFRESELERELRGGRPQPPDDLVHRLTRLAEPARRPRRSALPKLALVGAVTASLAASLGVAGALGYANGSVHSFGHGIVQLVEAKAKPDAGKGKGDGNGNGNASGGSTSTTTTTTSTSTSSDDPSDADAATADASGLDTSAFKIQYNRRVPICWHGKIKFVKIKTLRWFILHGAKPPWQCNGR